MPWFRPIFFNKIVSAVFEIFRKKEAKKHFFHARLQYLNIGCMVKYKEREKVAGLFLLENARAILLKTNS